MEQKAAPDSSLNPSSFAGMLASLAVPPDPSAGVWGGDELAEDVAVLSYESALLAKARRPDFEAVPGENTGEWVGPGESEFSRSGPRQPVGLYAGSNPNSPAAASAAPRKCASITIRLSEAESAQLRQRASEAGLTVSAYLRSCVFEVETLRAQVKQTVAELRTAWPGPEKPAPLPHETADRTQRPWWGRLWPHATRNRASAA